MVSYLTTAVATLNPDTKTLNKLTLADREEIQWLAQMGMPTQGRVLKSVERVVKVRKEMK